MYSRSLLLFAITCVSVAVSFAAERGESPEVARVLTGFMEPPADCRPHTRWWWMGNALRKQDIVWQLDQMQAQGIGGVEQITMEPVYAKGNHEYLSPGYFDLLRFAVEQAAARGMSFSINFGGPGWIWGGEWVPEQDRSKVLLASMTLVEGPRAFSGEISREAVLNPRDIPRSTPVITGEDRLVKVVAARRENGSLRADSLRGLSALTRGTAITWEVPPGEWQLMGFWLTQRDNANAVDHLNREAMARYCDTLGAKYAEAVGGYFGSTIESFFSDSFEVPIFRNGLYWSDGLFEAFKQSCGYDLAPWLPALWWDVDGLSPKVRFDVNAFLHQQGMTAFFDTFLGWCERHGVRGRIQPYGFVTDIIQGAGTAHLPEMEITPGEKDAVPWFDTRIGPREYTSSGAHLYGRNIVSAEAFTYIHWEPYRATLEELKIATDAYLRAGANKLYNHGYIASPERDIVPTRGFFAAIRISPENVWWPHYHHLAEYTARCCWLLRQGHFVADVAVYSPLANQWTQNVFNARKWTREFDWGGLGQLLIANGFGFDLVNDGMLQQHTIPDGAQIHIGAMTYQTLILPDIAAMPLESLRQVERFVRQGGTAIALERVPEAATGMKDYAQRDAEAARIGAELFRVPSGGDDTGARQYGEGRTFCLRTVLRRYDPLDWRSAPFDPFLKTLRACVPPDMDIDLVRAGRRTNAGLACIHRRTDTMDIYFLANFQDTPVTETAGLRTATGRPCSWDPFTGERRSIHAFARDGLYTRFVLKLQPYESRFIVFEPSSQSEEDPHMIRSDFVEVVEADNAGFTAVAEGNGPHAYEYFDGSAARTGVSTVEDLPAIFDVNGVWTLTCLGKGAPEGDLQWPGLKSWTEDAQLRHFSGRARYTISFDLPAAYFTSDTRLRLSLGAVGHVAEIRLNGQLIGIHWRTGQAFEIADVAQPGGNTLEVDVTNTLINRVSGLDTFPGVAKALRPHFGDGLRASAPEADRLRGFDPLPRSGLLGPVQILPVKEVRVGLSRAQGPAS